MKNKFWVTLITYLAYCIDKEFYKAIDYLKSQVEVLVEQQEKQNKRILNRRHTDFQANLAPFLRSCNKTRYGCNLFCLQPVTRLN